MTVFRFVLMMLSNDINVIVYKGGEVIYHYDNKTSLLEFLVHAGYDTNKVLCWNTFNDPLDGAICVEIYICE